MRYKWVDAGRGFHELIDVFYNKCVARIAMTSRGFEGVVFATQTSVQRADLEVCKHDVLNYVKAT